MSPPPLEFDRTSAGPGAAATLIRFYADATGEYLRRQLIGDQRARIDDVNRDVLFDLSSTFAQILLLTPLDRPEPAAFR